MRRIRAGAVRVNQRLDCGAPGGLFTGKMKKSHNLWQKRFYVSPISAFQLIGFLFCDCLKSAAVYDASQSAWLMGNSQNKSNGFAFRFEPADSFNRSASRIAMVLRTTYTPRTHGISDLSRNQKFASQSLSGRSTSVACGLQRRQGQLDGRVAPLRGGARCSS